MSNMTNFSCHSTTNDEDKRIDELESKIYFGVQSEALGRGIQNLFCILIG
ncbi:hypothetical protein BGP_0562 [Beggiatoa sp. PS]|nr:hypothetical protein BGP_0562 [Beggiatoa sp. PS]